MKKFLIKISYTVLPLWFLLVGIVLYISLYVSPRITGDIGNLSFIPFGHEYVDFLSKKTLKDTLFQTVDSTKALQSIRVDVLTIGDSFSQQKNIGYQNYLCTKGLSVANCARNLYSSPIQYAYDLLVSDIIDSTNTQVLVVENVERDFQNAANNFNISKKELLQENPSKIKKKTSKINMDKPKNEWSLLRARDFLFYRMGKNNPIYTAQLDKEYFTSNEPTKLYFYHDDIDSDVKIDKTNESKIRQTFEALTTKANEKGIELILMIAVDKYDLYQNHIMNNTMPKKTINEDLHKIFGENPNILLTKFYLLPLIENGKKDVFMYNDTHWSYKASKMVANELYQRIADGIH